MLSNVSSYTISLFFSQILAFLPTLLWAVIIVVLGILASILVQKIVIRICKRTKPDIIVVKFLVQILKFAVLFIFVLIAADTLGIPISSLLTLVAAIGAAVALAVKDSLANLASGVVLLFTKPFKAGDLIEAGGETGTIYEINMMYTTLDTVDNVRVALPNSSVMNAKICNYNTHDTRRIDLTFPIDFSSDVEKAKSILLNLAYAHPDILDDPAPISVVSDHGESSINLLIRFWVKSENYFTTQFDMYESVKSAFDKDNIIIPYKHINVHVDK